MRFVKKWLKFEGGQSIILVAVAIAALCGVAALVVDTGMVSVAQGQLQNAADAAALAAANDLPSASAAATTADAYGVLNGVPAANTSITTPYKGNANKVEVICTKTVQYTFARVIGINSTTVTARAVAEKTGMSGGPFGYSIFYGDPAGTLSLRSYDLATGGSIHSNGSIDIQGTLQRFSGDVEAVKTFRLNGYDVQITGKAQAADLKILGNTSSYIIGSQVSTAAQNIAMPNFDTQAINEATAAGTVYSTNKTYNNTTVDLKSSVYVKGDLTIGTSKITGKGTMLATGNISIGVYNMQLNAGSNVCLYTTGTNKTITIEGSDCVINGIIYAPYGNVVIKGWKVIINGSIVAKTVDIQGTLIRINPNSGALSLLPSGSISLCE